MTTSPTIPMVNPFSSDFKNHAYSLYEKLREHDPIHNIRLPNGRTAWIVTRYEDAVAALKADYLKKNLFQFVTPEEMGLPVSNGPDGQTYAEFGPAGSYPASRPRAKAFTPA